MSYFLELFSKTQFGVRTLVYVTCQFLTLSPMAVLGFPASRSRFSSLTMRFSACILLTLCLLNWAGLLDFVPSARSKSVSLT
jgi:hypothetical protein